MQVMIINVLKAVGMQLIASFITKKMILRLMSMGVQTLIDKKSTGKEADKYLELVKDGIDKAKENI